MFRIAERGDRKIAQVKEEAIILIGHTKGGSSAAFNWMLNKPMICRGDRNPQYVCPPSANSETEMDDSFIPKTVIPNIAVDFTPTASLVDMPGFKNHPATFAEAFGGCWFWNTIVEKVKRMKFVIVISEGRLLD